MNISEEDIKEYAPRLSLTRHTGALLWWFQETYSYRGSPEKLQPEVMSITLKNLLFGWWSPMSLIINPVISTVNWVNFAQYKKIFASFELDPESYIVKAKDAPRIAAEKADRNLKRALTTLGILIAIFVVIIIFAMSGSR